jgi:hypothetical protein
LPHKIEVNPLSAVDRKVLSTTNERKVMSKTTFFKRIALTAIAALGFGMLSVAPSSALVSGESLVIGETSAATASTYSLSASIGDTATAVVSHSFLASGENDSVVINVAQSSSAHGGTLRFTLTDSSNGRASTAEPTYTSSAANGASPGNLLPDFSKRTTGTTLTSVIVSDSAVSGTRALNTVMRLDVAGLTTAGTYTFTVGTENHALAGATYTVATGKSVTFTVTVAAADTKATAASTVTTRKGNAMISAGTAEGTDSAVTVARSAAATVADPAATIWVVQKNGAATANESMVVSVTGPAYVAASDTTVRATSGNAITVKNLWNSTYTTATPIAVWSTGTAGTATITVSTISGVLLGTETVKFTGNLTSMVIDSTYAKVLRAGGYAASASEGNGTIDVFLSDANGIGTTGTITMLSSDAGAVNASATTAACTAYTSVAGYTSDAYRGYYSCDATTASTSTSGMKATLTYRVVNPAFTETTVYFTVTHDVTLGSSASTWTVSADKTTAYDPGASMVLSATCVDASSNPCYDGVAGPTFLVANKSLGGTALASVMNKVYEGKSTSQVRSSTNLREFRSTNTLFAPNVSGPFTIAGTYGTNGAKSVSLALSVGDDASTTAANAASDAAAEAIDAANAATDAANLAAEAADAATVAAEEARDAADAATAAVEALATEVATLMAALKAQITTLANTVAKIAKKVKA